jgi:hypothetical protein
MVGAVLLTAGLLVTTWLRLGLPRPVCALKRWTGLPCPTCGTTRLGEALLRGDLVEAAAWNPLVFAFLAVAALWAGASTTRVLLGLRPWHVALAGKERRILAVAAVLAVVATWIYLIRRGV